MRSAKKAILFSIVLLVALFLAPNFVRADSETVSNETQLLEAIEQANAGDVISLNANIVLTKPVSITEKDITINGNGFTVTRAAEGYSAVGANSTLITAGKTGTKLHLMNMKLIGAEKYGVQSYSGAYVSLDGVTISDCGFGGVLVNAGTVEVRNLVLNRNGNQSNNGIEIAKGTGVYDEGVKPVLVMNGTLSSTETENVVYLAVNDTLTEFDVENGENTVDKIFVSGKKVVVTDQNNNVKFISNENQKEGLRFDGSEYVPNIPVTVVLMNKTTIVNVLQGSKLTEEDLRNQIDLASLELSNYNIDGFYSDEGFTEGFDFSQDITEETTIYAKLSQKPEKDNTPKTGFDNKLGLAIFVIAISSMAIVALKRK